MTRCLSLILAAFVSVTVLMTGTTRAHYAALPAAVVTANTDFAVSLYQQLDKQEPGKNLFFSPYSVSTALMMAYAGARGETAEEMHAALGFSTSPMDDTLHQVFGQFTQRLTQDRKQLQMANALWVERTFSLRQPFVDLVQGPHGAVASPVDFLVRPDTSRLQINAWAEQQTNGKITDLLPDGSVDSLTRLVLTNAIYFKGDWATQFDEKSTRPRPFTRSDDQQVRVPTMHSGKIRLPLANIEGVPASVLEMPYDGDQLSMVILLPNEHDGLGALERQLTTAKLTEWLAQMRSQEVIVALPKFKLELGCSLKPALAALGMPTMFTPGADFSGINESERLSVSDVIHKAYVDVNEQGTEAAAATAVIVKRLAISQPERFHADHPFLFVIRDKSSGTILFMGRVLDPQMN